MSSRRSCRLQEVAKILPWVSAAILDWFRDDRSCFKMMYLTATLIGPRGASQTWMGLYWWMRALTDRLGRMGGAFSYECEDIGRITSICVSVKVL